jgi:hypothetical protein
MINNLAIKKHVEHSIMFYTWNYVLMLTVFIRPILISHHKNNNQEPYGNKSRFPIPHSRNKNN